ncbi:unnamed protein product [Mytilus coruscus]|uniref:Uncharacterized protein n=1 Tax=Mytilus coruscus TaxID=42192 RepID=A0A6J8DFD4_MYTCO|nr:unnamed protein product [Mytilus coruscus]
MKTVVLLLKRLIVNLNFPDGLFESVETIIVNADPTNLVTWVCQQANIDVGLLKSFVDVLKCNTNKEQALKMIIEGSSKYLGLPTELINFFTECLYSQHIDHFQKERFISSKVGDILVKKMCSVLQIPPFTMKIIVQVTTKRNPTEKAFTLLQLLGVKEEELDKRKKSLTMSVELKQKYKLSKISWSYFQDLIASKTIEYKTEDKVKILVHIANDLGLEPVIKVQLICEVISTVDPFDRTMHVVRYFAVGYHVPEEYIEGLQNLILKKILQNQFSY